MSDGTSTLTFRDPSWFLQLGKTDVTSAGAPVRMLNELECQNGRVYANVYQTDKIVQIDTTTGQVLAEVDASGLLTPSEASSADVLNGIASIPERGTFLITGKHWPWMFEVRFVPA
jgi:glutamine cyclotransferase